MTPEDIIGRDAVLALSLHGFKVVEEQQCSSDLGPTDFEELWSIYPHKVAKAAAVKAYRAARRRGVRREMILTGVRNYVAGKPVDRPWLQLGTFCNQERWNDIPAPVVGAQRRLAAGDAFMLAAMAEGGPNGQARVAGPTGDDLFGVPQRQLEHARR